ncbi:hypothetical protein M406DRAFT_76204 [Cryphonectria parasitica EP155]|uniref:NACHT domain-containing protein n=1 Tax=Cryphonectria parasitica (strain ATCC 38755 / EP155) TaxID=660469 RepID=A0A9P4XWZ9_CRYP1|nr:uncharacterized protein M406DRAFT_76204 [Cryphonectria parasitica EP155]KAF3762105.1 hypothetical protein M406DRAFT_76204 [Cryphonectria parasitica EP155]
MAPFVTTIEQTPMSHKQAETPFSRAVNDFLSDLKKNDNTKNPFLKELIARHQPVAVVTGARTQTEASADGLREFVENLQTQKRSARTYRILERLNPFINSLAKLMGVCENLLDTAPLGVSIAFAGARIVLELALQVQSCLDEVVDTMEQIGVSLKCYEKFGDAFPTSDDVQDLLASSYKHIVRFWFSVSRILSQNFLKSTFGRISNAVNKEISKALDGLNRDRDNIIALAHATSAQRSKEEKITELRRGIIEWIKSDAYVDVRTNADEQFAFRHKGTCQWMFQDERFRHWCESTKNAVLWYNAKPGSGKSVYAATIIDHLQKQGKKTAYFFYSFNSPERNRGVSGLRSLALQLLRYVESPPDRLVDRYKNEIDNHATKIDRLDIACKAVQDLLPQCEEVYLIIDGLDECQDDALTIENFQRLLKMSTYGLAKWFFSSREHENIKTAMQNCKAVELKAETTLVTQDIRSYLSAYISCEGCLGNFTEGEDNFLYSRLICDAFRGEGLTSESEIRKALVRCPKDLNSYYIRVLDKLAGKSHEEQRRARGRRTFAILITVVQSISLYELLNLLAVYDGAEDHDIMNVPTRQTIQTLCSPFIIFGKAREGDVPENPLVKLGHKTFEEFFKQNPDDLDICPTSRLRKFFLISEEAHERMGLDCLTYLQYKRYASPGLDLRAILSRPADKEHAFLPYAATFWAQHLMQLCPTKEIDQVVRRFLQSRTFWTCLAVQAHVSPYLFSRYVRGEDQMSYTPNIKKSRLRDNDWFGLPLPDWLDTFSKEGRILDRSLDDFVDEWREVMTTYPNGLIACVPLKDFKPTCSVTPLEKSRNLKVANIEQLCHSLGSPSSSKLHGTRLLGATFDKKTLWMNLLCYGSGGHFQRLQIPLFATRKGIKKSEHEFSCLENVLHWKMVIIMSAKGGEMLEAWQLEPYTLTLRRCSQNNNMQREVPLAFARDRNMPTKGMWEIRSSHTIDSASARNSTMQAVHVTRTSTSNLPGTDSNSCIKNTEKKAYHSDKSWLESANISAMTSTTAVSDGDSNDDSDDDSDDASDDIDANSGSQEAESPHELFDKYEFEKEENMFTDCLIFLRIDGHASWHPWSNPHLLWSQIGCAAHPTLPLLAFTHTACQLELVDMVTGIQKTEYLSELSGLQDFPRASLRELRFSICGKYLHFLYIAFSHATAGTQACVTALTFSFEYTENKCSKILRASPPRTSLTHWNENSIIVALPPLTCDPKILKINLPEFHHTAEENEESSDENEIFTLREAIYFPTTTTSRCPLLMYRSNKLVIEDSSYLYLVLDQPRRPSAKVPNELNIPEYNTESGSGRSIPVGDDQHDVSCDSQQSTHICGYEEGRIFVEEIDGDREVRWEKYRSNKFPWALIGYSPFILWFDYQVFVENSDNELIKLAIQAVNNACVGCATPIHAYWDNLAQQPHCLDTPRLLLGYEITNLFLDFSILRIPLPIVWHLQLHVSRKLGLAGMFLLGIFACVTSILRLTIVSGEYELTHVNMRSVRTGHDGQNGALYSPFQSWVRCNDERLTQYHALRALPSRAIMVNQEVEVV